jgi:hydrogenase maturation protease
MNVAIIGLGSAHGDDQIGLVAVQALARHELPPGCTLHACTSPASELLPLLAGAQHAILVDAMVDGGPPGRVLCCEGSQLQARSATASSHGLSVDGMLALAAALGELPATVTLAGISIASTEAHAPGLSVAARAAMPALVQRVLATAATSPALKEGTPR